jgi:hypothetical protein
MLVMTAAPLPSPTRPDLQRLQSRLSTASWTKRYQEAVRRVGLIERLRTHGHAPHPAQPSRAELRTFVPHEDRTNLLRWWEEYHTGAGEPWERLFDRRWAPKAWETPEPWRSAVETLGALEPPPRLEQIRTVLVRRFGAEAALGDTKLREILRAAGLYVPGAARPPREQVVELHGGGGLVLLAAAAQETGATAAMAQAVSELARAQQRPAVVVPRPATGRSAEGQFTAAYNQARAVRLAEADQPYFPSVEVARPTTDLTRLRLRTLSPERLADHLLCVTVLPLLTARRGTGGADDPLGGWLAALGVTPYRAKTLEKTLDELKWLEAASVLWDTHARIWLAQSARWCAAQDPGGWRQLALYVDASHDPYWTERFAVSGKVSRTGRVQPCLARVVMSSGPGVPVLGTVLAGRSNLGDELLALLDRVDAAAGPAQVRRVTVVDAECCHLEFLARFADHPTRDLITVLKGPLARGKTVQPVGDWQPFRERDQLREGLVDLGRRADGSTAVVLRAVEMQRPDSRHPKVVTFLSTAPRERLDTSAVVEAYLARWPYQEDLFRRGRNGVGLERSSGYGVHAVTHVAVLDQRETAARRLTRTDQELAEAHDREAAAVQQVTATQTRLAARRATGAARDGRSTAGLRRAQELLQARQTTRAEAQRRQQQAQAEYEKRRTTPDEIYVRDTSLESVTTCFKMLLLSLLEFICQEYLGGRRITPRTFIASWVMLPVTIRTTRHQVVYELTRNACDREMTALLEHAAEVITKRSLSLNDRTLIIRLKDS